MQRVISRAPGEIFFFGEHSVVYGRRAIACAIDRWVTTTLTKDDDIRISSNIGRFTAKVNGQKLKEVISDEQLLPFRYGIERVFELFGASTGFSAVIESELPVGSGLASSAASSASLLGGIMALMDKELAREDMVRLVFKSELDIQKRGSISGSACTVLGGIVEMTGNDFKRLEYPGLNPLIIVADSRESMLTSKSTSWIKDRLDKESSHTQRIFDSVHLLATRGKELLKGRDWQNLGKLMNANQAYLKELGVSTEKIDEGIEAVSRYIYGSKITGAGGGGCFISLGDNKNRERIIDILKARDFDVYPSSISYLGQHLSNQVRSAKSSLDSNLVRKMR